MTIAFISGLVAGSLVTLTLLGWTLLVGRITTRDIADACDRLIESSEEPPPSTRRRTLS